MSSAFPPDAARDDSYDYYDSTTRSTVPVRYTSSAEREGRSVNVYEIKIDAPVKDPAVLKPLPAALPKALLAGLVPTLDSTARARLTPEALSALPDPVPLTYQGRSTLVAYIDRQTGIAIDQKVDQKIVATTTVDGEPTSLLPVSALAFAVTSESSKDLGDTAASAGLLLTVLSDVTPLVLIVVAALLLVIVFIRARSRKPGSTPASGDAPVATSPAQPLDTTLKLLQRAEGPGPAEVPGPAAATPAPRAGTPVSKSLLIATGLAVCLTATSKSPRVGGVRFERSGEVGNSLPVVVEQRWASPRQPRSVRCECRT